MTARFVMEEFLRRFTALGERQGDVEVRAREMIESILHDANISFEIQTFQTEIPRNINAQLLVDGEQIEAIGTSFMSGTISGKDSLISSMISSQRTLYDANINFNPLAEAISRANHYFAPSLAIAKRDVQKVIDAKHVVGSVHVEPLAFESANILVGNIEDPEHVLFAHYDSLGPGAVDNASGVAVMLSLIFDDVDLDKILLVFTGNEELSYDRPIYWGKGYRMFERDHRPCLRRAKKIFVIDSLGCGSVEIAQDKDLVRLAFPIEHIASYADKVFTVSSKYNDVMKTYHSDADIFEELHLQDISEAVKRLRKMVE